MTDIITNARPRLNKIVGTHIMSRYEMYAIMSTDMLLEMMFISSPIERIKMSRPRKSRRIPHVFPITYSKFDIDLV